MARKYQDLPEGHLFCTRMYNYYTQKAIVTVIALPALLFYSALFSSTVINCTSLSIDQSGPLRMSNCGNHYGAQCNFSCTIGYRLNGSSAVTCVGPGNQHPGVWNNTIPTCEGKLKQS